MSREPSYPKDAPVTPPPAAQAAKASGRGEQGGEKADAPAGDVRRRKHLMTGAAIGIGSAAIVAALLYANRSRRDRT